jgi:DNA-binding transcriptional regulator YhcF (GntR family)
MMIYTDEQMLDIWREYNGSGQPSLRELAERHYVSHSYLAKAFRRLGKPRRGKGTRKNKAMILHDWNSGKQADQMARTYGYASVNSLYQMIYHWRNQGWAFRNRRAT